MYNHFQKTRQLARGEGKIGISVDTHCIGTSGKTARSARPKADLLLHRNVWTPGRYVPQLKRVRIPCILSLYMKGSICRSSSSKVVVGNGGLNSEMIFCTICMVGFVVDDYI